jgi:catechol 2,3-dioxygenase-like lactoylglutathione lyase family enzyme
MIKVLDLAYVRFAAPDLDAMERFLSDFGLVVAARQGDALYARGTDPGPYVHVTERGEPAFRGLAFEAASAGDLRAAAQFEGASAVEKLDAPGGGERVRFTDPDGHAVEVVHGREPLPRLPVRGAGPVNRGSDRPRLGALQRIPAGPSCVKRLGHAGLRVRDFRRSEAWYKSRFGLLSSDEIYLGAPENVVAAFLRCDRGPAHTDHHTLVCIGVGENGVGLDHAAFEVEDFDAVMVGHEHLGKAGYRHKMGVGRHILGSQIYDYWSDPWGHVHEHFTDGDLLDAAHVTGHHAPGTALGTHWGSMVP